MSDGPGWTPPVDPAAGGQPAWSPPPGAAPPPPGTPGGGGQWGAPPGQYPGQYPGQPAGGQYGAPQWGQQNSPWGAAPVSRPGVIPLRPLALGEILDGAFTVIRHYPKVTLGLSAIVVAITEVLSLLMVWSQLTAESFEAGSEFDLEPADVLGWAVGSSGGMLLAGLLTPVVAQAVLGRPATFRTTWDRVRPVFLPLLLAAIVAGALPFLGLFLLAIPGIFLWGVWALVTPAIVMERTGFMGGFRRSWRLALPDWWRVWGTRALSAIIAAVLGTIIALPAGFAAGAIWLNQASSEDEVTTAFIVIILLAGILASTVTAPFSAGVLALLYIDRRMRAEGLDVTLAQSAAAEQGTYGAGDPAWPPAGQH